MVKNKVHSLKLKGYELDNGKISFGLLTELSAQLTRLATATLLSYVEGNSRIKKGKNPDWLNRSTNFSLTGIAAGSTVLEIEAPLLGQSLGDFQLPVFQDFDANRLQDDSALDLSFFAYEQALHHPEDSHLLDKNLLREIVKLRKVLVVEKAQLVYESDGREISVTRKTLSTIKVVEEKTPESIKTRLTGKLDMLKHSNSQLEIITEGRKIRAKLTDQVSFKDVFPLFGKDVLAQGTVNFNPSGSISSFEIEAIQPASEEDDFFRRLPTPVFQEFDLERITSKSGYSGTSMGQLLGRWPGDESAEDLLQMLDE